MSKYVLGGGLSGLIWSYYNPEYTLLTYDFGGFVDSKFGQAFVVLHETEEMVDLFKDLDVDAFVKRLKIGYYTPEREEVFRSFDETDHETGFARRYVEEKLPADFQPGKDLELSAPGDSWRALFVDGSIVKALSNEIENTRIGMIKDIDDGSVVFDPSAGSEESVSYDEIVSTVPASVFSKMCNDDPGWTLDHHPTTYVELESVPDRYRNRAWNLLYTVDPEVPYHRLARNMLSSNFFVECLGGHDFDLDIQEPDGYVDSVVNGNGVIADEDLEAPYDGISFLGRYAEWQHDVRIDHVISRAREGSV